MKSPIFGISVLSIFAPAALADFWVSVTQDTYITSGTTSDQVFKLLAIADNKYNCNTLTAENANGAKVGSSTPVDIYGNIPDFFTLGAELCGASQLDFYIDSSTGVYNFYNSGGDGTVLGTCVGNHSYDAKECVIVDGSLFVETSIKCDTYLCR